MRKYLILLVLLIPGISNSQTVDIKTAEIVAKNYFKNRFKNGYYINDNYRIIDTNNLRIKNVITKVIKDNPSLYIFNFSKGGWVITTANKSLGPIVAYNESGQIDDYVTLDDAFKEFLNYYEYAIDTIVKSIKMNKLKQEKWDKYYNNCFNESNSEIPNNIDGLKRWDAPDDSGFYLLDTEWGQSRSNDGAMNVPAYNKLMGGNCNNTTGNYLAGCTAVAIGQILKYWEYSSGPYADFDWWNMPDELNYYSNQNFNTQADAISKMLLSIGHRVNANFGCDGTSALPLFNSKEVFTNLGYIESEMSHNLKSLHTYNQWVDLLKNELNNNRPIQYNSKTHSFVCDGYMFGTNEFHFNLGWNGTFGGTNFWFNFEDIPNIEGATIFHECLTGIRPNWQQHILIQTNTVIDKYLTGNPLFVTHQAKEITIAGNNSTFTIKPEADCRFLASDNIRLLPGFWSKQGSTMLAKSFSNSEGTLKSQIEENKNTIDSSKFDLYHENLFSIYPNPSGNGRFFITINSDLDIEKITLKVVNQLGTILYLNSKIQNNVVEIDVSKFSKGIYFLEIRNNNQITNYKLIHK